MGLDIRINVTPDQVIKNSELGSSDPELYKIFIYRCNFLNLKHDQLIHTRPGSYTGIHEVRRAYAKQNGIVVGEKLHGFLKEGDLPNSHLLWHADDGGYYLPEDFEVPIFEAGLSIGSSPKLLQELRSIKKEHMTNFILWPWCCLLIPAVASVYMHEVIKFT